MAVHRCAYDTGMDASMLWQKVYSAWGEHRETIMGETPHWYPTLFHRLRLISLHLRHSGPLYVGTCGR
jgi:hypothetical protein|eukprot:COSAG01_NODE_382_length_17840_cov_68.658663_23_plen_68_part_00